MSGSHLAVAIGALAAPGVMPAWWTTRDLPRALPLVLPAGAVFAGLGGLLTLLLPGEFLTWWELVFVITSAAAAWACRSLEPTSDTTAWWPLGLLIGSTTVPLLALRRFDVFYDARSIWFLHGRLIAAGHSTLTAALSNPAYLFSHVDYPPLSPSAIALSWKTTGATTDYRLAQLLIGALTGSAVLAAVHEATRLARTRRWLTLAAGAGACLAAFGFAARNGTDGYADLLWGACGAGACIAGLVAPVSSANTRVALLLAAAAGLTKNEGLAVAGIVIVLTLLRADVPAALLRAPGRAAQSAPGLLALATILAWPVAVHLRGVTSDIAAGGNLSRLLHLDPTVTNRALPLADGLREQLLILPAALAIMLVASLTLRVRRRSSGLGNPGWLWAVVTSALAALVLAYLMNPVEIHFLLATSFDRTTIFLKLLLVLDLVYWVTVASHREDSGPVPSLAFVTTEPAA